MSLKANQSLPPYNPLQHPHTHTPTAIKKLMKSTEHYQKRLAFLNLKFNTSEFSSHNHLVPSTPPSPNSPYPHEIWSRKRDPDLNFFLPQQLQACNMVLSIMLKNATQVPPEYYYLFLKRAFNLFKYHKRRSSTMSKLLVKIFGSTSRLYLKSNFQKLKYQCRHVIVERVEYSLRFLALKAFLRRLCKVQAVISKTYFERWKMRSNQSSGMASFFVKRSLQVTHSLISSAFQRWTKNCNALKSKSFAASRISKCVRRYNQRVLKSSFWYWSNKLSECRRKLIRVSQRFSSAYLLFLSIAFRQLTKYIEHRRRLDISVGNILRGENDRGRSQNSYRRCATQSTKNRFLTLTTQPSLRLALLVADRWRDTTQHCFNMLITYRAERCSIRMGVGRIHALILNHYFHRYLSEVALKVRLTAAVNTMIKSTKNQNMWNLAKALRKLKDVANENFRRKTIIRKRLRKAVNDIYNFKVKKAFGTWVKGINDAFVKTALTKNSVRNVGKINKLFLALVKSEAMGHWKRVLLELKNHEERSRHR